MSIGIRILSGLVALPLIVIAFIVVNFGGGGDASKRRLLERAEFARTATPQDPLQVAVVWPFLSADAGFKRGISLAADELNESGGIRGRKIALRLYEETPEVAREIVKDKRISAVIGYVSSVDALKDSITYNKEGVLFIMPFVTNPRLTIQDFLYSFRTTPNDSIFAAQLVQQALNYAPRKAGATNEDLKILILAANDGYGFDFSEHFRDAAARWSRVVADQGLTNTTSIQIVDTKTYELITTNFLPLVDSILKTDFDAVLVADELPRAAYLIQQLRIMGVNTPVLGGNALDSPNLWNIASNKAFGVYFPSKYVRPTDLTPFPKTLLIHSLMERYQKAYDAPPNFEAAQAYEALHILAQAYMRSGSTVPSVVAAVMEHVDDWRGLMEVYSEFRKDELVVSNVFIKFLASADYPTNDFRQLQHLVWRDLSASPYTNQWRFTGYLTPLNTNSLVLKKKRKS